MSLQDNLAAVIRALMKQKDKSLSEFSEELGVSRNSLHAYSKGEGNPMLSTIEHIAERLGISPAALILGALDGGSQYEISQLLLDTIQRVSELTEEKRLRFAELFLELVKLWDEP